MAEDGGHAPQTVSGPIRFQGGPGALVRFIFQNWLPQMDSHHHSRIQNPVSYCWTTWQVEMLLVLPPGFAPGPRPHLGLTDHKSAVLLLHHGREKWSRAWDLRPALPLTGRARRFLRLRGSLQMVPIRGFAPRSADYRSAALTPELYGQKLAEAGGHAPLTCDGPIRFQGGPGALVRFIFQSWLPQMGSHHHSRIQNPESCLLDDTAKYPRQELHLRPQGPQPCVLSAELRG